MAQFIGINSWVNLAILSHLAYSSNGLGKFGWWFQRFHVSALKPLCEKLQKGEKIVNYPPADMISNMRAYNILYHQSILYLYNYDATIIEL